MIIGDLIRIKDGHPYSQRVGLIVDRTFEILPPGSNLILVYKVLMKDTIINVPLKWLVRITDTHQTQEK